MPDCINCSQFSTDPQPRCLLLSPRERAPIRACITAVILRVGTELKPSQRVLEVGAGSTRIMRRVVHKHGGAWYGVDPVWKRGSRGPRTWKATVCHLPFLDRFFDWAVAFDTMEHWTEFGESPSDGLREIARVLRPAGRLVVTVPIHLHGDFEFISGDTDRILGYFDEELWESVRLEEWRKDPRPLPTWRGWEPILTKAVTSGSTQRVPSTWTLEIEAMRR